MTTSKNGQDEAGRREQSRRRLLPPGRRVCSVHRRRGQLAECRRRFKEVFVAKQMAPDGSFPAELARTKPYGYSIFQLDNMADALPGALHRQDDLWEFALPDGRGIRKAMAFLYPYLADKSKWPRSRTFRPGTAGPRGSPPCSSPASPSARTSLPRPLAKAPGGPADAEVRRNIRRSPNPCCGCEQSKTGGSLNPPNRKPNPPTPTPWPTNTRSSASAHEVLRAHAASRRAMVSRGRLRPVHPLGHFPRSRR